MKCIEMNAVLVYYHLWNHTHFLKDVPIIKKGQNGPLCQAGIKGQDEDTTGFLG